MERRSLGMVLLLPVLLVLGGCSVSRTIQYDETALVRTATEVPEAARLDVGIIVFDPGLPENGAGDEKKGLFPEVRLAEARYMPYHLKLTLEQSGHWGSVWVVPERSEAVELTVWGRVIRSDGLNAAVRIGAWDATGREWLNKTYEVTVPEKSYSKYRARQEDPYQTLYNEIANDLLAARERLSRKDLETIRSVAELRYGAELVPAAFADLVQQDRSGTYRLRRLPAGNDPMVDRMRQVREREYAVTDTVNEYYATLYYQLAGPYEDWRKMSREEMVRYQDLRRSAFIRGTAGALAIIGAILYESGGGSNDALTMLGVIGGIEGLKSGFGKMAEANIYRDSLRELGTSFGAEAEPLVVEVEGQTMRLTGSAEARYREWRRLLHEIYAAETGLVEPTAPPAAPSAPAGTGTTAASPLPAVADAPAPN